MAHSSKEYMREYMRGYMRDFRSLLKAKHDLQNKCEKDIEKRFTTESNGSLNQITYALLYKTGKDTREMDNLDDIMKVYRELWKELETQEAILKEIR
jgi:myo-inositol-1-phosphate synthase